MSQSILTKNQKKTLTKYYQEDGEHYRAKVTLRYDDECGNGHNTFAITASIDRKAANGRWVDYMGGCCHEEIAKQFPELEKYIKWHLTSSDGPMHYLANTRWHASERDCWGLLKGERQVLSTAHYLKVNDSPFTYKLDKRLKQFIESTGLTKENWALIYPVEVQHAKEPKTYSANYTLTGMTDLDWYEAPFKDKDEASKFLEAMLGHTVEIIEQDDLVRYGEGKTPDIEAAREAAIWPDATLEQLRDEEALKARLPQLIAEFRADMEELGFVW